MDALRSEGACDPLLARKDRRAKLAECSGGLSITHGFGHKCDAIGLSGRCGSTVKPQQQLQRSAVKSARLKKRLPAYQHAATRNRAKCIVLRLQSAAPQPS